jgi:DNA replicative helicase MCM subunit Mcm2 (Cdc46/Mcm family)
MLESLVRLAQAHARLCLRDTVSLQDAVVVVNTMATSMDGADGEAQPWSRAYARRLFRDR